MNSKVTIGLLLVSVLFVAGCTSTTQNATPGCTKDALVCPDGSVVGRTGPDCEFKCPAISNQSTSSGNTLPPVSTLPPPANVKEFNMTAKRFSFEPSTINVSKGDRVVLRITSTDVEHGFSLATYNIIETLPVGETKTISFTAEQIGEFNFFCSVFCGSGHSDMRGKLIVNP